MIKKILPKELHKTKINFSYSGHCSYDFIFDVINFDRRYLDRSKGVKRVTEKYLGFKITNRMYYLFALLHELGHRQRFLQNKFNLSKYKNEADEWSRRHDWASGSNETELERRWAFWHEIEEEKLACEFAARYLKIWIDRKKG